MSAHNGMARSAAWILGTLWAVSLVSVVSMAGAASTPRLSFPPGLPERGLALSDSILKVGFSDLGGGCTSKLAVL